LNWSAYVMGGGFKLAGGCTGAERSGAATPRGRAIETTRKEPHESDAYGLSGAGMKTVSKDRSDHQRNVIDLSGSPNRQLAR
jgi:hypothetical protein